MNKHKALLQRSRLMLALPVLLMPFYMVSLNSHHARGPQRHGGPPQAPHVSVKEWPDTPLRIVAVRDTSTTSSEPELYVEVTNTSKKPISAYTVRYDLISGQSTSSGMELSIAALPRAVLYPNQSAQIDVGGGEHRAEPIDRIIVSVDFVEFTDGNTWGPDTYNSAERIEGQRAGGRAAIRELIKILNAKGPLAVMEAVETEALGSIPASGHSPEWVIGYRSGISYIQGRVIQAYKDGGVANVEPALRQPIDASDRRRSQ